MIKFEDLTPSYQRFILGKMDVDYRAGDNIVLEVFKNGTACITIGYHHCSGSAGLNPHGLQNDNLHKGRYKTPYFAYKNVHIYKSVEAALAAYNKWLEHREENIQASCDMYKDKE